MMRRSPFSLKAKLKLRLALHSACTIFAPRKRVEQGPKKGQVRPIPLKRMNKGYKKEDHYPAGTTEALSEHYKEILELLGENPQREGLLATPVRVAKAMQFLVQGYSQNPEEILKSAMFKEDYKQMVIVKDIEIYSLCEHHMLPFFCISHVAYIPNGYIVGLSKIPRVVDVFARRLQVQERLTTQIKECIQNVLHPLGVAVVIEAQHLCMSMRGVQKQNSVTTTSDFTGGFLNNPQTRMEFLRLIGSDLH